MGRDQTSKIMASRDLRERRPTLDDGGGSSHMSRSIDDRLSSRDAVADKFEGIFWIAGMLVLGWYVDLYHVIFFSGNIWQPRFNIGAAGVVVFLLISIYYSVVVKVDWDNDPPASVPFAAGLIVFALFAIGMGMWPAYGFFTPPLMFVGVMGTINALSFAPF